MGEKPKGDQGRDFRFNQSTQTEGVMLRMPVVEAQTMDQGRGAIKRLTEKGGDFLVPTGQEQDRDFWLGVKESLIGALNFTPAKNIERKKLLEDAILAVDGVEKKLKYPEGITIDVQPAKAAIDKALKTK